LKGWGKILLDLTGDGVAAQLRLLDPKGIRRCLGAHGMCKDYRLEKQLFSILALEIWLRVFHTKSETPDELGYKLVTTVSDFGS